MKTKKMTEAKKMEIEDINRQIREYEELNRQLDVQKQENRQMIKKLKERKRELQHKNKKAKGLKKKWDDSAPLIKLVDPYRLDEFKEMLNCWQGQMEDTIDIKKTIFFNFELKYQWKIFRALKKALYHDPPVFVVSKRQVMLYLSLHSNLGGLHKIKKRIQRTA